MATINQTGLAVLVAQLESMNELGYVQDGEPDQWIKELIAEFKIPDELIPAFIAYAEEFLQRPSTEPPCPRNRAPRAFFAKALKNSCRSPFCVSNW